MSIQKASMVVGLVCWKLRR